jgi:hypothetical protein
MKSPRIEQKTSSNYPSSSSSFKKVKHYFHPDDNFKVDHSWGKGSQLLKVQNLKTQKRAVPEIKAIRRLALLALKKSKKKKPVNACSFIILTL